MNEFTNDFAVERMPFQMNKFSDEKAFQRMFFHLNELANEYILIGLMIQVSND